MTTAKKTPPESNGSAPEEPDVLDLSPLAPTRRLVKFEPEGEIYEICLLDDFGIETQQQLMAWGRRYQKLVASDDDLSEKEQTRLRFLLESIFEMVLKAKSGKRLTKDELRQFKDGQRTKVVQAFTAGPLLERQEAQMEIIRRLVDRELVKQEQVDEILDEIRREVMQAAQQLISES